MNLRGFIGRFIKAKPILIFGNKKSKQRALVYYKTDTYKPLKRYFKTHTNQSEIKLLVNAQEDLIILYTCLTEKPKKT